jgi:predicted Zn finger-like uncharacterized protein
MSTPALFECPNCGAKYKVVRMEVGSEPIGDCEIKCVSCASSLSGREGPFVLKYFQVERSSGRRHAALVR